MGCYVILLMGIMARSMMHVDGSTGRYYPDCFCALEAKATDKIFNAGFGPWFQTVFKKELFSCPPNIYDFERCECKEARTITSCTLDVWKIRAVAGKEVSLYNIYLSLVTLKLTVLRGGGGIGHT